MKDWEYTTNEEKEDDETATFVFGLAIVLLFVILL